MSLDLFFVFAVTTAVVVITPGPAAITVASMGAGNGVGRAMFGIAGVASANAAYFALSAMGIASLMIASTTVFTIIKWAGVGYLVYLGLSAILGRAGGIAIQPSTPQAPQVLFSKGFIVEFANPKALLYFAAIVPQFLDVSAPAWTPLLLMGATTLLLDVIVYSGYALLGQALVRGGAKPIVVRAINKVAGGALVLAGVRMASVAS